MIERLVFLVAFLIPTTMIGFARADEQDIRACDFELKPRCVSGDARVTLVEGKVIRVEIDVFWCGLRGHPPYTCMIDSSRADLDSIWSEDGQTTLIANGSPWNPSQLDRIKVTAGRDVSIELDETQSLGRCGAGAELPRSIVIPRQGKACRVRIGEVH